MVTRARDGGTWRIGTDAEIAWIADETAMGRAITAAIPPVFEAYATVVLPYEDEAQDKHDQAVLGGPAALVNRFLRHPDLTARSVTFDQDATPPGHGAL